VRRFPAAIAALGLTAVALVGCSASTSTAAGCLRPTPSSTDALALVDVTGSPENVANVDVRTPLHATQTEYEDVVTGTGTTITEPNQLVVLDVTLVNGENGERTVTTQYDGNLQAVFPMSQWTGVFPGLQTALQCATEGSRVAVVLPPEGIDLAVAGNIGVQEGQSAVVVVDVRKVYLPAADGADQFSDAHGLPTVVRAPDGRPGVIIPDADAPTQPVVQVIKRGSGDVVAPDDAVRVHVTGVDWTDRTVTTTTWDSEPESLDLSAANTPAAFVDALAGQTVGSQVLVVVPAADGGPSSATAYVFDILGIDGVTP
jgi:FKBP-type peptidyl-prolyl cis-trans isomerase